MNWLKQKLTVYQRKKEIKKLFKSKQSEVVNGLYESIPKNKDEEIMVWCNVCSTWVSKEKYMKSWDWSGPHCPNPECNANGMSYMVVQEGVPISCRQMIETVITNFIK